MFTGLVKSVGTVVEKTDNRIVVTIPNVSADLGDSIAIDGCCLTVSCIEDNSETFAFDVIPDTIMRTRFALLTRGMQVNCEPALRIGDPLGGHWLQGHVDCTATVVEKIVNDQSCDLWIGISSDYHRYCMPQGSIAVNGVSLTVMEARNGEVRVSLVPETRMRTNLESLAVGDHVNIEVDVLARYVEHLSNYVSMKK